MGFEYHLSFTHSTVIGDVRHYALLCFRQTGSAVVHDGEEQNCRHGHVGMATRVRWWASAGVPHQVQTVWWVCQVFLMDY